MDELASEVADDAEEQASKELKKRRTSAMYEVDKVARGFQKNVDQVVSCASPLRVEVAAFVSPPRGTVETVMDSQSLQLVALQTALMEQEEKAKYLESQIQEKDRLLLSKEEMLQQSRNQIEVLSKVLKVGFPFFVSHNSKRKNRKLSS